MLPLLGVVAAAVLIAVGNATGNDTIFLIASALFLVFGAMYFKKRQ